MEERLRLQYSEDTNYIIQMWTISPYIIVAVYNINGKLLDLITEKGRPNVNEDEYKERIETCSTCEHLNQQKATCKMCGCYMPVKATWATSNCPKGKWKEIEKK